MKYYVFCLFGLLGCAVLQAQNPKFTMVWETPATLRVPESVLWDKAHNTVFFSNIDGEPNAKDSKGSIGKMSPDGKNMNVNWVTGLNAPKGLGVYKNKLFVADVDEIVVIDIKAEKVIERISILDAKFLNDVSVDKNGTVYVSDMTKGIIHQVSSKDAISDFLTDQAGVNGVLVVGEDLYFVRKGALWKADKAKVLTKIADGMDESTDGVEQTKNKNFIVSCWNGIIYEVKPDGNKTVLLDTRSEKLNTADIGYDADKNLVYVPTFFGNKIVTYKLQE